MSPGLTRKAAPAAQTGPPSGALFRRRAASRGVSSSMRAPLLLAVACVAFARAAVVVLRPANTSRVADDASLSEDDQPQRGDIPILPPGQCACGGVYSSPQVTLRSPGYPGAYPCDTCCRFVLRPPPGARICAIDLFFRDFALEQSADCRKDYLQVSDKERICGYMSGIRRYSGEFRELVLSFASDGDTVERGFDILVTQIPCESTNLPTQPPSGCGPPNPPYPPGYTPNTNYPSYPNYPTIPPPTSSSCLPYYPTQPPPPPPPVPSTPTCSNPCCASTYAGRRSLLTSPGFPDLNAPTSGCGILVQASSPYTCRLQITFKYFWLGEQDQCTRSFLEIDGLRFCGCRTGQVITVPMTGPIKCLRLWHSPDDARRPYSGFILEIQQEDCANAYYGGQKRISVGNFTNGFNKDSKVTDFNIRRELNDTKLNQSKSGLRYWSPRNFSNQASIQRVVKFLPESEPRKLELNDTVYLDGEPVRYRRNYQSVGCQVQPWLSAAQLPRCPQRQPVCQFPAYPTGYQSFQYGNAGSNSLGRNV